MINKYIAVFFAKKTNIHHAEYRTLEIAEKFCESWNAQGTVYSSHVVTIPPYQVDENTYWDEIAKELPLSTEVTWIAYNPDELFGDSSEDLSDELADGESDNHVYDTEIGSRDGEYPLAQRPLTSIVFKFTMQSATSPIEMVSVMSSKNASFLEASEYEAEGYIVSRPRVVVDGEAHEIRSENTRFVKILRNKPAPLRVTRKALAFMQWREIMATPPPPFNSPIEQTVYHFTTRHNAWNGPYRHEYDNEKDAIEAHDAFTACGAIVGLVLSSPVVVVDEFDDSVSPAPHVYTQPKTWIFTSSSGSIERSKHLCKSRDALEASRSRMMAAGYSVSEITEMVSIPARNLPIVKVFPANSRKFFAIPMNRRIKLARQRKYLGF